MKGRCAGSRMEAVHFNVYCDAGGKRRNSRQDSGQEVLELVKLQGSLCDFLIHCSSLQIMGECFCFLMGYY